MVKNENTMGLSGNEKPLIEKVGKLDFPYSIHIFLQMTNIL